MDAMHAHNVRQLLLAGGHIKDELDPIPEFFSDRIDRYAYLMRRGLNSQGPHRDVIAGWVIDWELAGCPGLLDEETLDAIDTWKTAVDQDTPVLVTPDDGVAYEGVFQRVQGDRLRIGIEGGGHKLPLPHEVKVLEVQPA